MHDYSVNMMASECDVKYLQLTSVYNNCNQHSALDASVSRHKLETYGQRGTVMFNCGAGHETWSDFIDCRRVQYSYHYYYRK